MSNVRIFLFILLLSAVMLEAAPGRWDLHEGILTNSKTDCKIEESPDQSSHLFSLSVVLKRTWHGPLIILEFAGIDLV